MDDILYITVSAMRIIDYTREQVEAELKQIWFEQACRLYFMSGPPFQVNGEWRNVAQEFLGCDVDPSPEPDSSEIDLSRFELAQQVLNYYDILTGAAPYEATTVFPAHTGPDLQFMFESLPEMTWDGNVFRPGTSDGICKMIVNAYESRSRLRDYVLTGANALLTVKQLALVANMTERAVRNAISSKDSDRLETYLHHGRVTVQSNVAITWLANRRNFQPFVLNPADSALWPIIKSPEHPLNDMQFNRSELLCDLMHRLALARFGTMERTAAAAHVDLQPVQRLFDGTLPTDEAFLRAIGPVLNFDPDELVDIVRQIAS